ncbi:hypothetical protein JR316_0003600 [Psilocybe cubensis]|uniref:Uncharacterized protein n=2 Tax=Psilocybe cubensis TaxID=181762 RepID=A0ACB8H7Z9_PSICU|nr:hypothetical protein JR316_0003600 [Psilocybe cubensis]KAH9484120.1 hypothetical protein JR316_0003600 [Psilocybe cubensis]
MSGARPTLLAHEPYFPRLLPKPPQPHPVPLPKEPIYGHLNAYRDIQREMDDLSDEEHELEELNAAVRDRGFSFLVPIGRSLTLQEEKNDNGQAEDDSEDSVSMHTGGPPSILEDDGENDSGQDLDESMEDLDEEIADNTEEMNDGDTEEYEEDRSELL